MVKEPMIIKRDGSSAAFDKFKIKAAILKAMKYGSGIYREDIANKKIYLFTGGIIRIKGGYQVLKCFTEKIKTKKLMRVLKNNLIS